MGKVTYYWHQLFAVVNPTVERVETLTDRKDGRDSGLSFEVSDSDAASISEEEINIDMPKAKNAEDLNCKLSVSDDLDLSKRPINESDF